MEVRFDNIENRLDRIESKLDKHMENSALTAAEIHSMKGQLKLIWTGIGAAVSGGLMLLFEYIKSHLRL